MKSPIILLLAFLGATLADHGHHDPNDDIHRMKDLQIDQILGRWFVMSYGPSINDTEHADLDCMEERIERNKDNQYLLDYTVKILIKSTKKYTTLKGMAAITDPKKPSELTYFFMNKVVKGLIVGSDYSNFLVVASHNETINQPIYWIMSRTQTLQPTITSTITSFFGLDQNLMKSYDFATCPKSVQSNTVDVDGAAEEENQAEMDN